MLTICKKCGSEYPQGDFHSCFQTVPIEKGRLALLEHDHQAMECLRDKEVNLILCVKGQNIAFNKVGDLADAILAEGDK